MLRVFKAEVLKLKGSLMPLWTALIVCLAPLMVVMPLGDGNAPKLDWRTFMEMAAQVFSSWYAIVLFGLVTAYVFGREYVEGTAKEMLTLPVRREAFLAAKAVVLAGWVLALTLLSFLAAVVYARLLGLEGASWARAFSLVGQDLKASALIFATLPVVALLAMLGRGYLAPMAYSAVMGVAGLSLATAGWTRWFPWSMQIGVTGMGLFPAGPMQPLVIGSWVLSAGVFLAGCIAVVHYADTADRA